MMKKATTRLTPTSLRLMLSISLLLIIAVAVTILYFANTQLKEVAKTVSHSMADAAASKNNLDSLKKIEKKLAEEKTTIDRVNSIVADSQSYQYQDQILFDLNNYAAKAGITITNLDFTGTTTASSTPQTASPGSSTPADTTVASGIKSTTVSVTLANPVAYDKLLRFIRLIEQNLTKMQISKVNLSKAETANDVTTDSLTIEVYIQ